MPYAIKQKRNGFSLVEVMVGMVIGMLVMLIIYQLYTTFEGQKRTSTGGAETQENGVYALSAIGRDIRMSGWGISNSPLLNCSTPFTYSSANNGPIASNLSIMPVRITDGGTGPDTITMMTGMAGAANAPLTVIDVIGNGSNVEFKTNSQAGLNVGDMVWMVQGNQCTLSQLTNLQGSAGHVQRNPGKAGTVSYNPPASYKNSVSWPQETGWKLYDVGPMMLRTYSVVSNTLQATDLGSTTAASLDSNIVSIKAQYGITSTTVGDQSVANWVSATGSSHIGVAGTTWASPAPADVLRIKAIRLAVVARSPLLEKPAPNGGVCATTTAAPTTWSGGPTIDLSADSQWKCYRYKTFQTIIPLRNVLWSNL
ncbi:PilW family protein [Collimonas humicola]|uniref:PilW family protein n=1 Tax=Collimonas humicola TaxID=2825886 RepID=UPI0022A7D725|nr:PilW family protein [Collimonas humicola]